MLSYSTRLIILFYYDYPTNLVIQRWTYSMAVSCPSHYLKLRTKKYKLYGTTFWLCFDQQHMSTMKLLSTRKNGSGRGRSIMNYTTLFSLPRSLRDRTPKPFRLTSSNRYLRETWQFLKETRRRSGECRQFAGPRNRIKFLKIWDFSDPFISGLWSVLSLSTSALRSLSSHFSHFSARVLEEDF